MAKLLNRIKAGYYNRKQLAEDLLLTITGARWIAGTGPGNKGELGFRIFGVNFFYYKRESPIFYWGSGWRPVREKEFGEVVSFRTQQYVWRYMPGNWDPK